MTHQFVQLSMKTLERVECPRGWMSHDGYARYLRITLAKMRQRSSAARQSRRRSSRRRPEKLHE